MNENNCGHCGEPLTDEETENPEVRDGDNICDECCHEHYQFTCCYCQNYGDVEDQHNLLVVSQECDSMGGPVPVITPGVYRINGGPYYGGSVIGSGYLFGSNLERIADLNPDMGTGDYPCGHLCLECQQKVLDQFLARCSMCRKMSPSCLRVKLRSWKDFKAYQYQWTRPKTVCGSCRHAHKGAWEMV